MQTASARDRLALAKECRSVPIRLKRGGAGARCKVSSEARTQVVSAFEAHLGIRLRPRTIKTSAREPKTAFGIHCAVAGPTQLFSARDSHTAPSA